jgi:drug/metabolite transporter (DMT)-like permease
MSWLLFAILPYALYSVTNYIEKFVIDKEVNDVGTLTILSGFLTIIVAVFLFVIKGFPLINPLQALILLAIGMLLIFYYVPYFNALSLDDASRVVPLYQFYPIFSLILSFIFLHERLKGMQFIGFGLITVGGFLLGTERVSGKIFSLRKSFWYMMMASLMYACTGILFRFVTITDFWISMSYQTLGIAIGGLLLFLYPPYGKSFLRNIKHVKRRVVIALTASQWITLLADFSYFYAITLTSVAVVSAMQGTQPLFLLLFGLIITVFFPTIIKEDISKKTLGTKIVAIILLFVGIILLYH